MCFDNFVYAIGGNNYSAEKLNLKTKNWIELKNYGSKLADNLGRNFK